jgi:hypothetical protein
MFGIVGRQNRAWGPETFVTHHGKDILNREQPSERLLYPGGRTVGGYTIREAWRLVGIVACRIELDPEQAEGEQRVEISGSVATQ